MYDTTQNNRVIYNLFIGWHILNVTISKNKIQEVVNFLLREGFHQIIKTMHQML